MSKVEGKVVLVTGANRGIGKNIVDTFIDKGAAKVYAAVRTLDSASGLVTAYGEKIIPIRVDLSDTESIKEAAKTATDVNIVVNNAGILETSSGLDDNAFEAMAQEMDVNVYGLMRMAQAFRPVLKANGGGIFVQLNSIASLKSFAAFATYSASKAASYSITQALRAHFTEDNIEVVSVHPGPIKTDMIVKAGLEDMGAPVETVGTSIIEAIENGEFHAFPDDMAKSWEEQYRSFAETIVMAD